MTLAEMVAAHDELVAEGDIEPFLFTIEPEAWLSALLDGGVAQVPLQGVVIA